MVCARRSQQCGAGVPHLKHASMLLLLGAAKPVAPSTYALYLSFLAMRCWSPPYKARINVVVARYRKPVSSFDLCFVLVLQSMYRRSYAVVWFLVREPVTLSVACFEASSAAYQVRINIVVARCCRVGSPFDLCFVFVLRSP